MNYFYQTAAATPNEEERRGGGDERQSLLSSSLTTTKLPMSKNSLSTFATLDCSDSDDSLTTSIRTEEEDIERNTHAGQDGTTNKNQKHRHKYWSWIALIVMTLLLFHSFSLWHQDGTTTTTKPTIPAETETESKAEVSVVKEEDPYADRTHYDVAYVNLMRHGEKDDDSGEHLSAVGYDRAAYYGNCMVDPITQTSIVSAVVPLPLGSLMAQWNHTIVPTYKGNAGLSQRSSETLVPVSHGSGLPIHTPCTMTDYDCFTREAHNLLRPNTTTVITWEHKLFPKLFRLLLTASPSSSSSSSSPSTLSEHAAAAAAAAATTPTPVNIYATPEGRTVVETQYKTWPDACDAQTWKNPRLIKPKKVQQGRAFIYHNACFDLVWQIKYVRRRQHRDDDDDDDSRRTNKTTNAWIPVHVQQIQNGYGGSSRSNPCAEGLKPIV